MNPKLLSALNAKAKEAGYLTWRNVLVNHGDGLDNDELINSIISSAFESCLEEAKEGRYSEEDMRISFEAGLKRKQLRKYFNHNGAEIKTTEYKYKTFKDFIQQFKKSEA